MIIIQGCDFYQLNRSLVKERHFFFKKAVKRPQKPKEHPQFANMQTSRIRSMRGSKHETNSQQPYWQEAPESLRRASALSATQGGNSSHY